MLNIRNLLLTALLFLGNAACVGFDYVPVAPPAPRVVARPVMPGVGYIWVDGYWDWRGGRHVWIDGRWLAPRSGYVWDNGYWQRRPGGWVWHPGAWRSHGHSRPAPHFGPDRPMPSPHPAPHHGGGGRPHFGPRH